MAAWLVTFALLGVLPVPNVAGGQWELEFIGGPVQTTIYRTVWEKSKDSIDVAMISRLVAQLQSGDVDVRRQAIGQLVAITGCDLGFDPAADRERREFAAKGWDVYKTNLRPNIKEQIPLLLQAPSWRNESQRVRAAQALGLCTPHPAFVPLLKEIVRNEEDADHVRHWALTSISCIPHDGMIEFLIEQLSTDLALRAWEQLDKLTGAGICDDKKDWEEVKGRYQTWWADHKETFRYDRSKAGRERN